MDELDLKELFSGRTMRTAHPGWHVWATLAAVSFWFVLGTVLLAILIVGTGRSAGPDAFFADWLRIASLSALFLGLGLALAAALPRLKSTYVFSDSCFRQISRNGNERSLPLNELVKVRFGWWNNQDIAISTSGTRIAFSDGLPEFLVMRSFCRAAVALNRLGATGERLVHLFGSVLISRGRITFREHSGIIERIIGFSAVLILGLFLSYFALFPSEAMSIWWRGLGFLAGAFFLWVAAFGIWKLIKRRRETITFHATGLDMADAQGTVHCIMWEEIGEIFYRPDPECPGPRLTAVDGREMAAISIEFRELYAIAYFIEHMRAGNIK